MNWKAIFVRCIGPNEIRSCRNEIGLKLADEPGVRPSSELDSLPRHAEKSDQETEDLLEVYSLPT